MKATTVGIDLPDDFPGIDYNRVHERVADWWDERPPDHRHSHFAGGWNAVAYRFVGAADAEEAFRFSVTLYGAAPVPQERLAQEKAIFTFYGSACSCLESFVFGVYALAGLFVPNRFLLDTEGRVTGVGVQSLTDCLQSVFPGDAFIGVVTDDILDPYKAREPMWRWRHVLTHRAAPGRNIYRGSSDPDAWSGGPHRLPDAPVTPETLATERQILSHRLQRLVHAANEFLDRRAVP
jgi:hypothetical protein